MSNSNTQSAIEVTHIANGSKTLCGESANNVSVKSGLAPDLNSIGCETCKKLYVRVINRMNGL